MCCGHCGSEKAFGVCPLLGSLTVAALVMTVSLHKLVTGPHRCSVTLVGVIPFNR